MIGLCSSRLQFTRDGRQLIWHDAERVTRIDARGKTHLLELPGVAGLAAFADQVWTVTGTAFTRWTLEGRRLGDPVACVGDGCLVPTLAGAAGATWSAAPSTLWMDDLGTFRTVTGADDELIPFVGRRVITVARARGQTIAKLANASWTLPTGAELIGGAALFDGASVVLVVVRGATRELWTSTAAGVLQHRIAIPNGELRIAARRGLAIVCDADREVVVLDLRFGRQLGSGRALAPGAELAIDPDGGTVAIYTDGHVATALLGELMREHRAVATEAAMAVDRETPAPTAAASPAAAAAAAPALAPAIESPAAAPVAELAVGAASPAFARPLALAALTPRTTVPLCTRAVAVAWLHHELELVAAWTQAAIATGWDTRRLGYANESVHPHEHEVAALLGKNRGHAADYVAAAKAEYAIQTAALIDDDARRAPNTPLGAFAAELGLSPLAIDILLVVAAPAVWGEAARLYGILANDPGRPTVDELLVHQLLGIHAKRHDIARELDQRGPLIRSGAIAIGGPRPRPFAELTIDPVVVARLRAEPIELGVAVTERDGRTGPALEALHLPRAVIAGALDALALAGRPGPERRPVRIVVRGKRGAGRRTLLAALAAEAHRPLAVIDVTQLPAAEDAFVATLRLLLRRSQLAGQLPCVAGLDDVSFGERTIADVVKDALRNHPGPLALVLGGELAAPLDPGHITIVLPALEESERVARWTSALAARDLWVRDVDGLAARYRVTTGVIERAVEAAAAIPEGVDASDAVEAYVRQTRDARLGAVATRVEKLATWSSLVLPADVYDSVRELIARVRHRRTVFDKWGMSDMMATSRGLTALFQGVPGTGKTLVAGVIARELGLDLYQVDLSKVMSKWIGETERNLGTVFDAAEDGQVILLFDEADSLFAKRTDVRSSNDRYANLEVNYLLQRLDSFQGIAILTTNFGGSIDPAFKRRLSFRLSFPFPDEDTRVALWRAHLPPQLPIAGELDLDKLARKYQLAGGYIRNACLRAAFLAAQDDGPLCQRHLERAVELEFAELGKLSSSGALD